MLTYDSFLQVVNTFDSDPLVFTSLFIGIYCCLLIIIFADIIARALSNIICKIIERFPSIKKIKTIFKK